MQGIGSRPKLHVSADGSGVVGHAGARLLADLAEATGLTTAYSTTLRPLRPRGTGHDPGRTATDLAVMLADGGEAIADLAVLRDQGEVFGPVASTPTAWSAMILSTADTQDASLVTSSSSGISRSALSAASRSKRRPAAYTVKPRSLRASAAASPIPDVAPVTSATGPDMLRTLLLELNAHRDALDGRNTYRIAACVNDGRTTPERVQHRRALRGSGNPLRSNVGALPFAALQQWGVLREPAPRGPIVGAPLDREGVFARVALLDDTGAPVPTSDLPLAQDTGPGDGHLAGGERR
ncbi:Transposase DDE domain group 1 [Streptomyces sp. MnatMP-M17]|nr:Transposase DDE domain group 1 [Streptomyces sp. MnatMP-M17]